MKIRLYLIAALILSIGLPLATLPAGGDDEVQKKVDAIRKQLEELRNKEKALLEMERDLLKARVEREREKHRLEAEQREKAERERKAKFEAEKKKHFAKVEIRGLLVATIFTPNQPPQFWHIRVNELTWQLQFDDKKELIKAMKLKSEGVVVTGKVVTTRAGFQGTPYYPLGPISPMQPWQQPPNPFPMTPQMWPGWNPNLMQFVPEPPPIIIVESIKAAKD